MWYRPGIYELLIILLLVIIIFGPKNFPALGKLIGKAIKGIKGIQKESDKDDKEQ